MRLYAQVACVALDTGHGPLWHVAVVVVAVVVVAVAAAAMLAG